MVLQEAIFIFDDLEINVKTLVHLNRNGKNYFTQTNTHRHVTFASSCSLYSYMVIYYHFISIIKRYKIMLNL